MLYGENKDSCNRGMAKNGSSVYVQNWRSFSKVNRIMLNSINEDL